MNKTNLSKLPEQMRFLVEEKDDLLDVVLRAHLYIEQLLDEMLGMWAANPQYMKKANLSFAQKVNLVRALNLHHPEEGIWKAIFDLNSVRNDFAHHLSSDERQKKIRKFIDSTNSYFSDTKSDKYEYSIYEELLLCFSYLFSSLGAIKKEYEFRSSMLHDLENRMLKQKSKTTTIIGSETAISGYTCGIK